MKVKLYTKKITEADEIQDGNDSNGNSQETSDKTQDTEKNTETSELDNDNAALMTKKNALKNVYNNDLKIINDQIVALQKQKADIDNSPATTDEQAAANKAKLININIQLAELANKKNARKNMFNSDMKIINQQLVLNTKEMAKAGDEININIIDESERTRKRFGKKLFEAVVNRTDEMYAAIKMAFDKIENLSYSPDNTQCKTFAKNIVAYLNKIGWESGENEKNFKTFMYGVLNASHISFSNAEKDKFVDNLMNIMKENTLFNWVFRKNESLIESLSTNKRVIYDDFLNYIKNIGSSKPSSCWGVKLDSYEQDKYVFYNDFVIPKYEEFHKEPKNINDVRYAINAKQIVLHESPYPREKYYYEKYVNVYSWYTFYMFYKKTNRHSVKISITDDGLLICKYHKSSVNDGNLSSIKYDFNKSFIENLKELFDITPSMIHYDSYEYKVNKLKAKNNNNNI